MNENMTLEIAKVGVHGEAGTVIDESMLSQCVDTFNTSAPVALGHSIVDFAPAIGEVKKVYLEDNKKTLIGEVQLNDLAKECTHNGYYPNWSVGIKKRGSDGKHYIHHLALLGATPPKIKGLKRVDGSIFLSDNEDEWVLKPKQEEIMAKEEITELASDKLKELEEKLKKTEEELRGAKEKAKELVEKNGAIEKENTDIKQQAKEQNRKEVDGLISSTILEKDREDFKNFADAIFKQDLNFSDDSQGKDNLIALFKKIIQGFKPPVPLGRSDFADFDLDHEKLSWSNVFDNRTNEGEKI